jgi:hypothetical protein
MVVCPKTFDPKAKCSVHDFCDKNKESKNKELKKLADDMKGKRRVYFNILDVDDKDKNDVPQICSGGVSILQGILDVICDPDYGDITDPEEGREVTITKTGKGLNTEYSVMPKPKTTQVDDIDEIMDVAKDVEEVLRGMLKTNDEIKALLDGTEGEDPDGDDLNDEEGEEPEDGEEEDYSRLSLAELKEECEDRGIDVPKKAKAPALIALLEASDEEAENPEDEEQDYSSMSIDELIEECKERDLVVPKKAKASALIALLEADDAEDEEPEDEEPEDPEEEDEDEVEKELQRRLAEKRSKTGKTGKK